VSTSFSSLSPFRQNSHEFCCYKTFLRTKPGQQKKELHTSGIEKAAAEWKEEQSPLQNLEVANGIRL
jgi:hypothetical protein